MLNYRLAESRGLTLSLRGGSIGGEETETLGCFLGPFQKGARGAPSPPSLELSAPAKLEMPNWSKWRPTPS